MQKNWNSVMKTKELLSVVLSLIIVLGVTAGSAYAQTDDIDDNSIDNDSIDAATVEDDLDDDKVEDEIDGTTADDELDDDRDEYEDDRDDDYVRDYVKDEDRDRNVDKDMRHKLDRYCDMSDEDKREYIAEHDKTADKAAKMDRFCTLNETDRADFIDEHRDEYRDYMKDKMHDRMTDKKHMDYDRLCSMADSDRALEITDVAKLDRISEWCNMTPEEREEYKMKHRDVMKDKMDKVKGNHMNYDRICALSESDRALEFDDSAKLERISNWCDMSAEEREDYKKEKMTDMKMDKVHDKMKMSDMSPRLKAMIMEKRDISDERTDELRMKYKEMHGDYDAKKSELKIKFKNHMATMKIEMSDERKTAIHDRVAEMKAFKIDLRERSSELSDEEKQGLRAEFIEKAKDIRLAWISPRHQMNAGIDAAEIECREGFSLVMKESNGAAMCLKADTALKMIERGMAVPAI